MHRGVRPERALAEHRSNRLRAILKRFNAYSNNDIERLGETLGDATALAGFLAECNQRNRRCVRVITGKGFGSRSTTPVLKAQVDRWLRLRAEVLAFCSTIARDGGTGAVYVLLRHAPHRR